MTISMTPFVVRDLPSGRPTHGARFGMWELDGDRLTLELKNSVLNTRYEIDLEQITSSAKMLDVIFQVQRKSWGGPNVASLLEAFDVIFQPQANLCSCGASKEIEDISVFLRARIGADQTA